MSIFILAAKYRAKKSPSGDVYSGMHEDVYSGMHEDVYSGMHEDVYSGMHEDVYSGMHEKVIRQVGWVVNPTNPQAV
jgi:hypothetical protein